MLGAGTGQSQILKGLKNFPISLTSVVNVTDNGGSSRAIRESLQMPQPGDSRRCLEALVSIKDLTKDQKEFYNFFSYRFGSGELKGVSLGNLMLAALAHETKNSTLSSALLKAGEKLGIKTPVLPVTDDNVHVCARLKNKSEICGEWNIIARKNSQPIEKVFLDKPGQALAKVISAIKQAHLIIIAPGSLYTGIIPLFLVNGIKQALCSEKSYKVWAANVMSQPGISGSLTIADHIHEIEKYSGIKLNAVIINKKKVPSAILAHYKKFNSRVLEEGTVPVRIKAHYADVIEVSIKKEVKEEMQNGELFEKYQHWTHVLRHDVAKIAKVLSNYF